MNLCKNLLGSLVPNTVKCIETFLKDQTISEKAIPLGPAYITLDPALVDRNLRLYRMAKNWCEPTVDSSKIRRDFSIKTMLEYDTAGAVFLGAPKFENAFHKNLFECARMRLAGNLERHYRFKPENFRFPKGETYVSAAGDISILAKLRDRKQLAVTADCFEKAAELLYAVPGLRKAVKSNFLEYTREDHTRLYQSYVGPSSEVGFYIFKQRLLDIVTIVDGMKLDTVAKSAEVDRVIAKEPFLNMLVQSVVEEGIRHVIKVCYGIDLDTSQDLHQLLIRDLQNATIDLKNASNSVFLGPVRAFLAHTTLLEDVLLSRSPIAINDNEHHVLNMVSPMGNGFTFGLMTLFLLALSRELDSFSHVFGDDIIVDCDVADELIALLQVVGFTTNDTKTFTKGTFRESCGSFWSLDHEVVSFEFEYPETVVDCFVTINKVFIIASKTRDPHWVRLHQKLIKNVSPIFYGPFIEADVEVDMMTRRMIVESRFVFVPNSTLRTKRTDDTSKKIWSTETVNQTVFLKQIQCRPEQMIAVAHVSYIEDTYRNIPLDNVKSVAWVQYYMYTGRCSAPSRRTKAVEKRIRTKIHLIPHWSAKFTSRNHAGSRFVADCLKHIYV